MADGTSLAAAIGAGLLYGVPIAALLAFLVLWVVGVRGEEEPPIERNVGEPADDPVSVAYRAIEQGDLRALLEALGADLERTVAPSGTPRDRREVRREVRRLRTLAARWERPPGRRGAERRRREREEFHRRTLELLARVPGPARAGGEAGT